MLPAYRRRQLLIVLSILGVLVLPLAAIKLWRGLTTPSVPTLPTLYGDWRAEPYDIAGMRIRLPIAQFFSLQENGVALDQSPVLPAQLRLDGDQLTITLDGQQMGSLELDLTVESGSRLFYPIPFTTSRVYFRKVGASQAS